MKVFWIFAHPESRSVNASLRDAGVRTLHELGHECQVSDLYAMGWTPVVRANDYRHDPSERLYVAAASKQAYVTGALSEDIQAEQEKLEWADALIVQFPLWWYGMPAILKGWFDRVFVKGFAYGVIDSETGKTRRYGEGKLTGKRAMVVLTAGAPAPTLGPRGINGELNALLFPLQHGTLWYAGMSVLPPFLVPGADRVSEEKYASAVNALRERLVALPDAAPIAFRYQNGGDYDDDLVLREDHARGRTGLAVHSPDPAPVQPSET
jgi:NAD(P)H dehydrogenase (quinone)